MDEYFSPLEALLEIRHRVKNWPAGDVDAMCSCICDCFDELCEDGHEVLHAAFISFPDFSGDYTFPLGEARGYVFGWDYEPRLRLLDHCIQYFEEN